MRFRVSLVLTTLLVCASWARADCNNNGRPDDRDVQQGFSPDCDQNGVPDECDTTRRFAATSDMLAFPVADVPAALPIPTPPGAQSTVTIAVTARGPLAGSDRFFHVTANGIPLGAVFVDVVGDCPDEPVEDRLSVPAAFFNFVIEDDDLRIELTPSFDVDAAACPDGWVQIAINYDAWQGDCNRNGVPDECDVALAASADCNDNGTPDECEADCNRNGRPDDCEIVEGSRTDCNGDGRPDDCETDCNGNDVPDECELRDGTRLDCDENGQPDDCDADCNDNGLADRCDIAAGTEVDCDRNGKPDECEPDCNGNGVTDACDIRDGFSVDCNRNRVPDDCEFEGGDCNGNGILDECDTYGLEPAADACSDAPSICPGAVYVGTTIGSRADGSDRCGSTSSPDVWFAYTPATDGVMSVSLCGSSFDTVISIHSDCQAGRSIALACNDDACGSASHISRAVLAGVTYRIRVAGYRIGSGDFRLELTGPDCQLGAVSPDCNGNTIPDECEQAAGTAMDCDGNGILDECELVPPAAPTTFCFRAQPACPAMRYAGSTVGGAQDGLNVCGSGETPAIWFRYVPEHSGRLVASLCGSSFDTVLSIHRDCGFDAAEVLACNDDSCGRQSKVTLDVTAGRSYYLRVAGFGAEFAGGGGEAGPFILTLTGPSCAVTLRRGDCNGNAIPDACDRAAGVLPEDEDASGDCGEQTLPGDLDGDADVDLADWLVVQVCFAEFRDDPRCRDADLDVDGDVDLADVVAFASLFTGSR